jgi:hypothetical protein
MKLHATHYLSLRDTKVQREHLHTIAKKLEYCQNITDIKKMMETSIHDIQDYDIIEKPQNVYLISKASGLPALHIAVKKD